MPPRPGRSSRVLAGEEAVSDAVAVPDGEVHGGRTNRTNYERTPDPGDERSDAARRSGCPHVTRRRLWSWTPTRSSCGCSGACSRSSGRRPTSIRSPSTRSVSPATRRRTGDLRLRTRRARSTTRSNGSPAVGGHVRERRGQPRREVPPALRRGARPRRRRAGRALRSRAPRPSDPRGAEPAHAAAALLRWPGRDPRDARPARRPRSRRASRQAAGAEGGAIPPPARRRRGPSAAVASVAAADTVHVEVTWSRASRARGGGQEAPRRRRCADRSPRPSLTRVRGRERSRAGISDRARPLPTDDLPRDGGREPTPDEEGHRAPLLLRVAHGSAPERARRERDVVDLAVASSRAMSASAAVSPRRRSATAARRRRIRARGTHALLGELWASSRYPSERASSTTAPATSSGIPRGELRLDLGHRLRSSRQGVDHTSVPSPPDPSVPRPES